MKTKLLFLITLIVLFFVKCQSDDNVPYSIPDSKIEKPDPKPEPEPEEVDIIIGTWYVKALVLNGMDLGLNECETKSTITFLEDGILKETEVDYACVEQAKDREGKWKNIEDNKYEIRVDPNSANAYLNDVVFSELKEQDGQIILSNKIQHEGENEYQLDLVLGK